MGHLGRGLRALYSGHEWKLSEHLHKMYHLHLATETAMLFDMEP